MAKKKHKFSGSNLRILSIAYAGGRIDRNTYLKLRTMQLGALEFKKPIPELPSDLMEINIPSVKVDASQINASKSKGKKFLLYPVVIIVVLGAIGAGLWYAELIPGQTDKPRQTRQLEPRDYAQRLLKNPEWSERDINAFLRIWGTRTPAAKTAARNTRWYLSLENEIIKRINKLRLQLETRPESLATQRELEQLRLFYGQLTSN